MRSTEPKELRSSLQSRLEAAAGRRFRRVRRVLGSGLLAVATLLTVSTVALGAELTISPAAGSQADTFTIEGTGLEPGLALDVNFVSPEGAVYSTAALNRVVVVDSNGDFEFSVNPADDFAGSSFGSWTVQLCAAGTDNCVQTEFEINP